MYISRILEEKFLSLIKHFPAVAVLGPRQVGKTTFVKKIRERLDNETLYIDLENPVDAGAFAHPVEFLNSVSDKTVIIDEIQRKPDLFPVLRSVIDTRRVNGRFILLGSASPQLLFLSNETLAGRIIYLELTPFIYNEIKHLSDFRAHLINGGFPVPFGLNEEFLRKEWFKSFVSAYFERDLRLLGLSTSPSTLQRLFQMIAASQAGILNMSNLAKSLGVSSPTVNNMISFYERSFMIRLLKPWHSNIGKRLVKSPKIYIRDSGIVNYILGITTYSELLRQPSLGQIWEGYVIEEIISTLSDNFQYYYYRTADGTECDLAVFKGDRCAAVMDMKFAPAPSKTKSLTISQQDLQAPNAFFIVPQCPSPYKISENQFVATPWQVIEILTR
jgi:predicted AAA+ superfamily ATPase